MANLGRQRPDTTKATALAIAATSSVSTAAEVLGIPRRTIRDWVQRWRDGDIDDAALEGEVGRLVMEYRAQSEVKMAEAISKAIDLTTRTLDFYLSREGGPPLKMSEVRDLNVSAGIMCDKLLALRGQPSSVSARFSYSRSEHVSEALSYLNPPPAAGEGSGSE